VLNEYFQYHSLTDMFTGFSSGSFVPECAVIDCVVGYIYFKLLCRWLQNGKTSLYCARKSVCHCHLLTLWCFMLCASTVWSIY